MAVCMTPGYKQSRDFSVIAIEFYCCSLWKEDPIIDELFACTEKERKKNWQESLKGMLYIPPTSPQQDTVS
jgi:hypothetical protein